MPEAHLPVIAVCGDKNAGKTTLIEALIPNLQRSGLAVAVIKHGNRNISLDRAGKDTDRFFTAGAATAAVSPAESVLRLPLSAGAGFDGVIARLLATHDIVLVEGHRRTPVPHKIWLLGPGGTDIENELGSVSLTLPRDVDRVGAAAAFVHDLLQANLERRRVRAGVLIGGRSTRMGRPKHLLTTASGTWLESIVDVVSPQVDSVALLGTSRVPDSLAALPQLPDSPGRVGPMAGIVAAMHWDPSADWLIVACDMPYITPDAVRWLLDQRRPGTWATLPQKPGHDGVEPLLAVYGRRALPLLEPTARPQTLAEHDNVATPPIPGAHISAWMNINTPDDRISGIAGDAE